MIVYTAMSPQAIETAGWTPKIDAMFEKGYRPIKADEFFGRDDIPALFPPYVMHRLTSQLEEQGMQNPAWWNGASWSINYDKDADVVWFRLMVL